MDADLLQMLLGLVIAVSVLVTLVLRTRVHAFPALIIAALIAGTVGGYGLTETLESIKKGFGGTLGSIGKIRIFGKGREEIALCAEEGLHGC